MFNVGILFVVVQAVGLFIERWFDYWYVPRLEDWPLRAGTVADQLLGRRASTRWMASAASVNRQTLLRHATCQFKTATMLGLPCTDLGIRQQRTTW